MEKVYHPTEIESKWYRIWEQGGYFKPKESHKDKSYYCIMIPPPNVTGSLHMGHALQDTLMDALTRYHRMQGHPSLWQVGTDHAGIATQMVVERQLNTEQQSRHSLGREEFIKRIWKWKEHSGKTITQQLRRLGASVDWETERFTMDTGMSAAVQQVFIQLYEEQIIYRGKCLVNWDPKLHTAVSDLEVVSEEENGFLWHIRYPIVDSDNSIVIATTRPETMLGDVAVAVHPEDERYQDLIGCYLDLPLCNRKIPIIADNYVDPEFGTGCVKITPAHDFNDYEVGIRHNLEKLNIFTPDAKINTNAPEQYQGLDRLLARKKIIEDLTAKNLLVKTEDHVLKVPRGDRTGVVIEPYLTDQWFVKVESLAKPAIEVVKAGKIKFIPSNWSKTYFEWMNNIQDWCISRQLWWGHRIPAWYDDKSNIYVGTDENAVREKYNLSKDINLHQDEDVLDTWFSSALWPFSTLGWPEQTERLAKFYPTNVLVTGFDIIFFWVARMIMFGLKFTDQIPFKEVYVHGLIQDQDGKKMSKSKGNVLDPIDLIDGIDLESLINKRISGLMQPQMADKITKSTRKQFPHGIPAYGTDALRFTFCQLATTGRHIRFDTTKLESNRNFCNKIWNAARYVVMNVEGADSKLIAGPKSFSIADQWILSLWQQTKQAVAEHFAIYRFDLVAQDLYEFTWNQYCDWYLELSKPILTSATHVPELLRGTRYTLLHVLEEILRVMHPIMPFITEEIWSMLFRVTNSDANTTENTAAKVLIDHSYPQPESNKINPEAETTVEWIKSFIVGVRNIRGEMNISPNKLLAVFLDNANSIDKNLVQQHGEFIQNLAKLESIVFLEPTAEKPLSATALVKEMKILIPMQGLINKEDEIARLNREMLKLQKELQKSSAKLANPNYAQKAPSDVVAKEKAKVQELQVSIARLEDSLKNIANLS